MPNLNIPLTVTSTEYITLLPDGTIYANYSGMGGFPNSIGEKKRVRVNFSTTYPAGMGDVNLWMQVAIYQQGIINSLNAKVPINHAVTFPTALTPGTYPMAMMLPVAAPYNVNNNVEAKLIITDATHFTIEIDFYQIYDETTYQNNVNQDNHNKLFRDNKQAITDLTLGPANTCYNSTKSNFCVTMRFEKSGQVHPEVYPDVYPYTDNANIAFGGTWLAGFYNRNPVDNPPYFSNPQFLLTRSAVTVTNLSVSQNTDVKFQIDTPTDVDKVLVWIIRSDKFDNVTDMYSNYEADFKDIVSSGSFADKIVGPIQDVTLLGGSTYEIGFSLDKTKLVNGAKYRLIAIVYRKDGLTDVTVNSFISEEYTVSGVPCYEGNGFDVRAVLDDYNRQFEGNNLECAIEERMRSKVKLYFAFNKWKDDIFNRLGLVVGNDIRRYLVSVSVTIFEQYTHPSFGDVVNIFDFKESNKIGVSSYTAQSGMSLSFGNNWAEFIYEWRNRFEQNIPNPITLVNGYNTIPVLSTQYWGGKQLTVRWVLKFTYDNFSTPFTDEVIIDQHLRVKDYGDMVVAAIDGEEKTEDVSFCQDKEMCFAGIFFEELEDRKLIATIRPIDGTITGIEEAEVWEGNQLAQMTTPKIINEEEDYTTQFDGEAAKFCIDGNELIVNSQYIISAMAKKFVDTGRRITEELQPRITENEDKRVIN